MKNSKGRIQTPLDPEALRFSSSLSVDKRLYHEDIQGSIAHVQMLEKQKIISRNDAEKIVNALKEIEEEIQKGKVDFELVKKGGKRFAAEDIHMAIENRLIKKIGSVGGKMRTARSRNDQIALDERLFLRNAIQEINKNIRTCQKVFVQKAEEYFDCIIAGYTHLQRAQPILVSHQFLAYTSMLERDHERFADCDKRVNRSPLGAAALAGTSFPIDRNYSASLLHFDHVLENSIDSVSDRDVHIEFLSAIAITAMHLSRIAEDLVLWTSKEWNFAEIDDAFATSSSIMPQKKNPDMAELIRGKTGRVYGNLFALLTIMKGLPLAYNRDMQEDKEPLFDSFDTICACLSMTASLFAHVKLNTKEKEHELESDFLAATDIADYLVEKEIPFAEAHSIVGNIVHDCIRQKTLLKKLSLSDFQKFSKLFDEEIYTILDIGKSILRKKSSGSTSPIEVRKAINSWKKKLNASSL